MKAIVLEIKNGEAAVLREDGIVVTTRQNCQVGDTIEVDDRVKIGGVKRFNRIARLAIVAMLVICIAGGSFGYMTASASSYVSVDAGETSLEFGINRFGRVISVEGLDEGSEEFAQTIAQEVKNKKFDEAMDHKRRYPGGGWGHLGQRETEGGAAAGPAEHVPSEGWQGPQAVHDGCEPGRPGRSHRQKAEPGHVRLPEKRRLGR